MLVSQRRILFLSLNCHLKTLISLPNKDYVILLITYTNIESTKAIKFPKQRQHSARLMKNTNLIQISLFAILTNKKS